MKFIIAAILAISVGIASAYAGGFMMLHIGSADGNSSGPSTQCTSTGIYDLSNTCNDIYFIGALK